MRSFDLLLAFDASLLDMISGCFLRRLNVAFPGCVHDDALELGFFIKEVRDIKERVALKADVNERRLHPGQHAHHATLVKVPDDTLILFAAFDVKLSYAIVFDNRDLLFATINTNN